MPFSGMRGATFEAGHEAGHSNCGAMQVLTSRQPSAMEAVISGRAIYSVGKGPRPAEKVKSHHQATAKRSREVAEGDETESQ